MNLNFFPSRWPIMCAVMNGASDLNLALAVHDAGAMPSLFLDMYDGITQEFNFDLLDQTLTQFVSHTGACNLVLSVLEENIMDIDVLKLIRKHKVSHVELLGFYTSVPGRNWDGQKSLIALKYLKTTTKIMERVLVSPKTRPFIDAYCIKGSESGGMTGNVSVSDLFDAQQKLIGDAAALIPYGGIGTPEHVRKYIERGATAVAVGTLFAASKESCLSVKAKESMCAAQSINIVQLKGAGQNALILGKEEDVQNDRRDGWNRQRSSNHGMHGNGTQGHIYAGKSIDYVTSIKSVKEIVEYLTSELPVK